MPQPLVRWRPVRAALALLVCASALLVLVAAWYWLLWLFAPARFLVALAVALSAPVAAVPIWRGIWKHPVERIGLLVFAVAYVAGIAFLGTRAIEEARVRDLGIPTESHLPLVSAVIAVALAGLAGIVASLPPWPSRRANVAVVAVGVMAAIACLVYAATLGATTTCADLRITPAGWQQARSDDRDRTTTDDERFAQAIVACDHLAGATRSEVRQLLGRPYRGGPRRWRWSAGWTNDGLGPGDGRDLIVEFDDRDRVTRAQLSP